METRFIPSLSFIVVRATTVICIALTWLGLYKPRAAVSQNNRSETKYSVREIFRKKAAFTAKYVMRKERRAKRSGRSSRSTKRAAALATARRKPHRRTASGDCRSRSAEQWVRGSVRAVEDPQPFT